MAGDASLLIQNKSLVIEGPSGGITLNGGWNGTDNSNTGTRILVVSNTTQTVTIRNVNFVNGHGFRQSTGYYQSGAICSFGPLVLENCAFSKNSTYDSTFGSIVPCALRGGGAVYAERDLTVRDCLFATNCLPANSCYGGAILQISGRAEITDTTFDGNTSASYGAGAITFGMSVTNMIFRRDTVTGSCSAVGQVGGAINVLSTNGTFFVDGCIFRDNKGSNRGGVISCISGCRAVVANSEFSNCYASWSGGIYDGKTTSSGPAVFANCTFFGGVGGDRGGAVQLEGAGYFINCTIVGNFTLGTLVNAGAINTTSRYLLNSVVAYNFCNAANMPVKDLNSTSGLTQFRSLYDGKSSAPFGTIYSLVTNLADVVSATNLFAAYETRSTYYAYNMVKTGLTAPVIVPSFAEDVKQGNHSRVIGIGKDSVLCGSGYPVKANADYSYVAYSTNEGSSWTTLYGTDDGTAKLIDKDQRGIPYYKGKTPIGAATVALTSGLFLILR